MYKSIAVHARSTYWTHKEATDESVIDSDDLAEEIENACNKLAEDGYEVIQITPIISGNLENGTGYHQTESVIITASKKS